ncbi:hypothetical protein ACFXHD_00225 [Streptomyces hydrogenans]|uniref:hypothetical protein n=1 Tax=Streptomyces hydrogenans TaxID=1873719 RepID=UPI0036C05DC6
MPKKKDPEEAAAEMRARGFTPSVTYPGAIAPWPGTCDKCGRRCSPRYANVVTSGQGPCRRCSGSEKRTEDEARAIMTERGLTPQGPYPGNNTPWTSVCGTCKGITAPTLTSVRKALRQKQPKGCDLCRRNGAIAPEEAADLMRAAGAEPLVPFPGIKRPWRSLCLNEECGREVAPVFDSIKHAKTGACKYCGGYGIRADDPAFVYLVVHDGFAAVKVGIGKAGSDRMEEHAREGWDEVIRAFMLGHQARAVEAAVLELWRDVFHLPYGVQWGDMRQAGYTETIRLVDRSVEKAKADLAAAVSRELGPELPL